MIPVILRPADWRGAPFGKLQALPRNAKPVTRWADRDEAFLDIVEGIRKAVEELAASEDTSSPPASVAATKDTSERPRITLPRLGSLGLDSRSQIRKHNAPVITFYSYKGGTGRSMALANLSVLLARDFGQEVIAVDWDLEAPGLHRFFGIPDRGIQFGIIDFLWECWERAESGAASIGDGTSSTIKKGLIPVRQYPAGGRVLLLGAGAQDGNYAARVRAFDWARFYSERSGGEFVEQLRLNLKSQSGIVLIDSRTGVSDMGSICTIQLPDTVVLVFAFNEQNVAGVESVARELSARISNLIQTSRPSGGLESTQGAEEINTQWVKKKTNRSS